MADPDHTGERVGGKQGEIIAAMLFDLQLKADALKLEIDVTHENRIETAEIIHAKLNEMFPDPWDRVTWGKKLVESVSLNRK